MSDHPDSQVSHRDKNVPWYNEYLEDLNPGTRELLESYSEIPQDQILPHIYKVVRRLQAEVVLHDRIA